MLLAEIPTLSWESALLRTVVAVIAQVGDLDNVPEVRWND
jgi:hypothetical protein